MMGYLPQFKNDLFISYRRNDNESYQELNWIDRFRYEFGKRLRALVSDDVYIWRDEEDIKGGEDFRKKIAAALDTTAVFLAVISATYLQSQDCVDELNQFLGKLKEGTDELRIRVVPIIKHPWKPRQHFPPELLELLHYEFFEKTKKNDSSDEHIIEFSPAAGNPTAQKFWSSLERLAVDLSQILDEAKEGARKRTLGTLYLAEVEPELKKHREDLRTELQQRNYLIIPETPLFWNATDFEERIVSGLNSAELSIHLIPANSFGDRNGAERARRQLARALSMRSKKASFLPLIWIQPGAEPSDETSQALIQYVQTEASNQGAEYLRGGLEEFKTHIYDKLERRAQPQSRGSSRQRLVTLR